MWKMISLITVAWMLVGCEMASDIVEDVEEAFGTEFHVKCEYAVTCMDNLTDRNVTVVDGYTENKCMSDDDQGEDRAQWDETCSDIMAAYYHLHPGECIAMGCKWDCNQVETLPCL